MPRDNFAKRRLGALGGVFAEQLCVGLGLHLTYYTTVQGEIRQRILEVGLTAKEISENFVPGPVYRCGGSGIYRGKFRYSRRGKPGNTPVFDYPDQQRAALTQSPASQY